MIVEYHRPRTLAEALELLARPKPITLPLGGGTVLNRRDEAAASLPDFAVVDVQSLAEQVDLGLKQIQQAGNLLIVGAAVTLQGLLTQPGLLPAIRKVAQLETGYNIRQVATVAGTIVAADGRSPFTTLMLAMDAVLECASQVAESETIALGDLLPLRADWMRGKLITRISLPTHIKAAYEYVARTLADRPMVCAAVVQWPAGRTRVVLGGYGRSPLLAMDGPTAAGAEVAAGEIYRDAGDEWASAEYRSQVAEVLVKRCLDQII